MFQQRPQPPYALSDSSGRPASQKNQRRRVIAAVVVPVSLLLTGLLVYQVVQHKGRLRSLAAGVYRRSREAQQQRVFAAQVSPLTISRPKETLVIYQDTLGDGWQNWSWATVDMEAKEQAQSGKTAIRMTPQDWKAAYLHHDAFSADGYGTLQFYLRSTGAPALLRVSAVDTGGKFLKGVLIASYSHADTAKPGWSVVKIPLADLNVPRTGGMVTGFVIQAEGAQKQPDVFLDTIALLPDTSRAAQPAVISIPVTVNTELEKHPISPYIYGMAFAPPDYVRDLRLGSNRWGGNDKTRYNWVQGNACNAARDWNFANRVAVDSPGLPEAPSSAADQFVRQNTTGGAATLLTVPTIGWVARDTDNSHTSKNVPGEGGVGDTKGAIPGYDPSANRSATSVPSFARKKRPFTATPTRESAESGVYQDEWVYHLTKTFGAADKGGVKLYAMDNEPDLWDGTHTDVHPAQMGYDNLLSTFLDYANAVKDVDPAAKITGPVSWGWTGYQYSPLDRGSDNFHTAADRVRHGDEPFLLWFLKKVHAADTAKGNRRSLDVLDVHYYPQASGLYNGTTVDGATFERRIRATRSLWDETYTDESWINKPISLIPLLKKWIAQGYPGTRIGVTEWNFGGDKDISGALAIAETLGVYGREDVYLANYWAYPPKDSPGYLAFKLFRNANEQGQGFGDQSCQALSGKPQLVSSYAAIDTKTKSLTVLLINKMPDTSASVPLILGKSGATTHGVIAWRIEAKSAQKLTAVKGEDVWTSGNQVKLPPYSITLLRFPAQVPASK
jgi:hypothetical protein